MGKSFDSCTKTVAERTGQDKAYIIDSSKARRELNWDSKIIFGEGLKEVISWIEANWGEIEDQPLDYFHKP
jgi:dTDP-glucose 4,6-dehydratase